MKRSLKAVTSSAAPHSTLCSCQSGALALCSVCVRRSLQETFEQRQVALQEWRDARETCRQALDQYKTAVSAPHEWSELACEVEQHQQRLERLQRECQQRALKVAQRAVAIEERRAELTQRHERVTQQRRALHKLTQTVLQDSLVTSIASSQQTVHRLRVQWAVTALNDFFRLQVDPPVTNTTTTTPRQAKGIGKLAGLPLPHAGLELFGFLPPAELQSTLRLVATLILMVSQCLAIPLPHPILLTPPPSDGGATMTTTIVSDIADAAVLKQRERQNAFSATTMTATSPRYAVGDLASSTSSLVASWMGLAATSSSNAVGTRFHEATQSISLAATTGSASSAAVSAAPSLDASQVQRRIHHARSAVLAEDDRPHASQYALRMEEGEVEAFGIAWQLLQNDLVALCIRAGVPVQDLWPAEAVLLNLHALGNHLQAIL